MVSSQKILNRYKCRCSCYFVHVVYSSHLHGFVLGEDPDVIGGGPGGVGDHVGHHQGDVSALPRLETDTEGAGEGTGEGTGGGGQGRGQGEGTGGGGIGEGTEGGDRGRGDRGGDRGRGGGRGIGEGSGVEMATHINQLRFTGWFPWRRPLPPG